jgi:hypothetical protein
MQPTAPPQTRNTAPPNPAATPTGDFAYETFYGAAIGGATIALFFLVLDSIAGRPLFTPSLMGTALFTETSPTAVSAVRVDMVALYSVVHFGSFLLFGAAAAKLRTWVAAAALGPFALVGPLFVLLTAAFAAGGLLPLAGVGSAIGWHWVLAANLATAVAMTAFLARVHAGD